MIQQQCKTIGSQLHVKEEYRKRAIDVYAYFARSFEYQFTINIPTGYSVEGA